MRTKLRRYFVNIWLSDTCAESEGFEPPKRSSRLLVFLTTFTFTWTIFSIICSDVVVWTISPPYWNLASKYITLTLTHSSNTCWPVQKPIIRLNLYQFTWVAIYYFNLGAACIVSTPFMKNLGLSLRFYFDWSFHPISQIIQLSKPSPKEIFLNPRIPFIRAVTPSKLSNDGLELCTRPVQSTTLPTFLIFYPISMNFFVTLEGHDPSTPSLRTDSKIRTCDILP